MSKEINIMKAETKILKGVINDRFERVEAEIELLKKRLDRLDAPVNTKGGTGKKRVPAPDRPAAMDAAGVGKDPLRGS